MQVRILDSVLLRLQTIGILNRGAEFSGFGWCRIEGKEIVVYDFILLDLGSETWTEIPASIILPLMEREDRANMKVWAHAHPVGNGIPGPHNWSGTDEHTCTKEPMGGSPDLVGWSVAIVRTPGGWVGRIDNHRTHKTQHLEVFPSMAQAYQDVAMVRERKNSTRRSLVIAEIADQFDDIDLEQLDFQDRESLEDWIREEFGDDLLDIETSQLPWYETEEIDWRDVVYGGKKWTTRDTGTYSGRRI